MNVQQPCSHCQQTAEHLILVKEKYQVCTVCGKRTDIAPEGDRSVAVTSDSRSGKKRMKAEAADNFFPDSKGLQTAEKIGRITVRVFKKMMPLFRALNRL